MWRCLCCCGGQTTSPRNKQRDELARRSGTTKHREKPVSGTKETRQRSLSASASSKQEKPVHEMITTTSPRNKQRDEEKHPGDMLASHSSTTDHQKKLASETKKESLPRTRQRSLSASTRSKPEKPVQEMITTSLHHQASPKPVLAKTSACNSSDSVYETPPESRHQSTISHPLNKIKRFGQAPSSVPSASSSPTMILLRKLEAVEHEGQKRHEEVMEAITKFTEMFTNERSSTRDGVPIPPVGSQTHQKTSESPLPQNVPVCSSVILDLSKRLSSSRWKFLGRRLKIPDHEIDQIEANNREDIQEQSYQMLLKWTKRHSRGSYQELGEAVRMEFGEQLYSEYVEMVQEYEEK